MVEDIKSLIEKIQKEGVQAAEAKAKQIEDAAVKTAQEILNDAKSQAGKIIAAAKEEAERAKVGTNIALKQASRDMLISLRKEINSMLERLITSRIQHSLKADELAKIIFSFIKDHGERSKEDIVISLSKKDAENLTGFIEELKSAVKGKIIVRPSEDIQAGFEISFDAGKSEFDFSDKALVEYIVLYLKPKLNEILKDAVS
jgi:V/A-type H+-transporting ATPase subunit E